MSEATEVIDAEVGGEVVHLPQSLAPRTVQDVLAAMNDLKIIRTFIANELIEGTDYGVIPGTGDKKNLLKPGAEKIAMFFNTRPEYTVERCELGNGHVEYIVQTKLISRTTGLPVGAGLGSCSTMEGKYRYRNAKPVDTGQPVPKAYWTDRNPELLGGKEFTTLKVDGVWHIARKADEKVENDNIHDIRNTVLKMAKKRSMVDASIALGCLSELFTQDLEDIFDLGAGADLSTEKIATHTSHPKSNPVAAPVQVQPPASKNSSAVVTLKEVEMKDGKPRAWKFEGVRFCNFIDADGKKWKFQGDAAIDAADKACGEGLPLKVEYTSDKFGKTVLAAEIA